MTFWPFQPKSEPPAFGDLVHEDAHYRVTVRAADGDVAVLAFCGVGLQTGGVQVEEFRTSLGAGASVYYIADLQRSWWNDGRVESAIEAALAHARQRQRRMRFSALGNSMGGSGALLAARLYGEIERVVAFVPQADIRPTANEDRWHEYRDHIAVHRWPHFAMPLAVEHRIVFGATRDAPQREAFEAAGMPVLSFAGMGHDVAKRLKTELPDDYRDLLRFALFDDGGRPSA